MSSSLRRFALDWAAIALVFLPLDALWLAMTASRLYRPAIGHLMRTDFDAAAAALFYAIYIAGVAAFAMRPAIGGRNAFARGALFGLVCYATYDLTNQATLIGWPWQVTAIDLAWGAFATGIGAALAQRLRAWRRH